MPRTIVVNAIAVLFVSTVIGAFVGCETHSRRATSEGLVLQNHSEPRLAAELNPAAAGESAAKVKGRFVAFQGAPNVQRRIIYDANVSLVVKDMTQTETQIASLLKKADGYVAEANVDRRQGEQLTAVWRVRVPVGQFDSFLDAVSKLGVAENRKQTAQDITEEFVDLEAQIKNKKQLEERIVALIKDASGKIKDVIEIEHELARVRGEIEQMEGRLRYLTNRTDFTTVSISARVEENYVPPAAPSFASRIAQAWGMSVDALKDFGEQLTIAVVYAFPWLVVLGVVAVPVFLFARKRTAASREAASTGSPQT
jgi:cell division septum initiation protein DivIVA